MAITRARRWMDDQEPAAGAGETDGQGVEAETGAAVPIPTVLDAPPPLGFLGIAGLQKLIDEMRDKETAKAHGNRKLFLADIVTAYLLAFFNPIAHTLRTVEDMTARPSVQAGLGIGRIPRSTLSDMNKLVDPALLMPMLAEVAGWLPKKELTGDLAKITQKVLAVDGTFIRVCGELAWAIIQPLDNGKKISRPRLDVHLDVASLIPSVAVMKCKNTSEADSLRQTLVAGALYLVDRGFVSFPLIKDIIDKGSDVVLRLTSQIKFEVDTQLPLDQADREAGVVSDSLGKLSGCEHSEPPTQGVREVLIQGKGGPIRLLTTLGPHVPARLIGELYRRRWTVELFFRWMKVHAKFNHAISHSKGGLSVALYVAIIGTMLMCLKTGQAPSKYALNLLAMVACGEGDFDEMLPILARRAAERQLERERLARKKKAARDALAAGSPQ